MDAGVISVGSDSWHCLEKITVAKKYNNQDIKSFRDQYENREIDKFKENI